jgi:hypothetical protein
MQRAAAMVVMAFAWSTAGRAADDLAALAGRVPGDACLAVLSADVAATCEAFQKTNVGRSLCGPDFSPLIKELARLDLASPLRMRPAFGLDWSDLTALHGVGGFVVFPLPDGSPGTAWLFANAKPANQPPAWLVSASDYFRKKGYTQAQFNRAGGAITLLRPPPADRQATARAVFVGQGFHGIANSWAAAEILLAAQPARSLAAQATFSDNAQARAGEPAAGDVCFYVRPLEFERLARPKEPPAQSKPPASPAVAKGASKAAPEEEAVDSEDPDAKAHRLGWDALQSVAGWVAFGAADPCEWQIDATVHAPAPYRGMLRMLELQAGPLGELPNWISAGAKSVATWRWDFAQAIHGFGSLFDEANQPGPDGEGMFEDMLDALRDDPEGVRVDLRRGLFELLAPDMLRIDAPWLGTSKPRQSDPPRSVYVARALDEAAIKDTLARFYKGDDRVRKARVGDFDTWTVDNTASLFVEGESDSLVTVRAIALGQGQLFFGTETDSLQAVLAPSTEARLSDDATWKSLSEWMKKQETPTTSLRSFVRLDAMLEPGYRSATAYPSDSDALAVRLWRQLLFGSGDALATQPRAGAPDFDRLRTALAPAGFVMSRTQDGWAIRVGALRTPASPAPGNLP